MPNISIAFRFHVNFYHSYRGDAPDETGFGKDIRIIRGILDDLDALNDDGIPVRGTWDIENHFTLESIVPRHAPDILERWQDRVRSDRDEIELMSWNNGLVSAQDEEEFRRTLRWSISNPEGSGLEDLFDAWAPIVRPQECLFTPAHLRLYPEFGIRCVSLYYSAHPFNGFSTHVPLLDIEQRYNPLDLTAPGYRDSMILLPAYNHADIAEYLGLRRWLKRLRKKQADRDLLLILDMDADDPFWTGYGRPASLLTPAAGGLQAMVRSIADLPWLQFSRPADYLQHHETVGEVSLGQDTADGSYDGLSSWAEKRENTRLWTGIDRSRLLSRWTRDLLGDAVPVEIETLLEDALRSRIVTQSTTHFGLAYPVMHHDRLRIAEAQGRSAYDAAHAAFDRARDSSGGAPGAALPGVPIRGSGGSWCVAPFPRSKRPRVPGESPATLPGIDRNRSLVSKYLAFSLDSDGGIHLAYRDEAMLETRQTGPGVRYRGRELSFRPVDFRPPTVVSEGLTRMSQSLEADMPGNRGRIRWHGDFYVMDDGPWVLADLRIRYPDTPHDSRKDRRSGLLNRTWDSGWQEIRPLQLTLRSDAAAGPNRLWKRSYFGDVSYYDLDRRRLSSANNQITGPWIAHSRGNRGLLVVPTVMTETNFAFCPVRVDGTSASNLRLNPFGTYSGPQRSYPTARNGLAKFLALRIAQHLDSYAPSFGGADQRFSLLLLPYHGDAPPGPKRAIAEAFAFPPYPGHIPWDEG